MIFLTAKFARVVQRTQRTGMSNFCGCFSSCKDGASQPRASALGQGTLPVHQPPCKGKATHAFVPRVKTLGYYALPFQGSPSTRFDFSSFRRKPESRKTGLKSLVWIPACAGMTGFRETCRRTAFRASTKTERHPRKLDTPAKDAKYNFMLFAV